MTDADVRAVLEAAAEVNEWCHLAMRLAAETGARRSELAALRWDALVGDRLIVDRQVIVAKGDEGVTRKRVEATKTGSRRAVSLSASTLELVQSMAREWAQITTWMLDLTPNLRIRIASAGGGNECEKPRASIRSPRRLTRFFSSLRSRAVRCAAARPGLCLVRILPARYGACRVDRNARSARPYARSDDAIIGHCNGAEVVRPSSAAAREPVRVLCMGSTPAGRHQDPAQVCRIPDGSGGRRLASICVPSIRSSAWCWRW